MELLKTSKLINDLYKEKNPTISYEDFIVEEYKNQFETFSKDRPYFKFKNVMQINQYFNYFINISQVQKIHIVEYFNKSLNFVIVYDFLKSFNKDNSSVNEKVLHSKSFMFSSFVILNHFLEFSEFLSLHNDLLEYLKSLIILYCLSLTRKEIEEFFGNTVNKLDQYFHNNVFINLCIETNYKNINDYKNALIEGSDESSNTSKFKEIYSEIISFQVGMNKYDKLLNIQQGDFEAMRIITMIGIQLLEYSSLDQSSLEKLFQISYNMGYLHIIQLITNEKNFTITQTIYDIISSRNELPPLGRFITNNINKYLFLKYKDDAEFVSHIAKGNYKVVLKEDA